MYNFDEFILRGVKESIQKCLKFGLKFEKMSAPLKGIISIEIDSSNNFLKAHEIEKHSEIGSFRVCDYKEVTRETSISVRSMYICI